MALFAGQTLLKGGVICAIFWGAWFENSKQQRERRTILLSTFFGATASLVIARAIALLAPFRERPIRAFPNFQLPYSTSSEDLIHWSSFPSDHAALFIGLAVGILLVSKRLGIVALIYSVVFICIPRIYDGLHYPSDILVGGLIGTGVVLLVRRISVSEYAVQPLLRYESEHPSVFYMISFFVTAQLADMFIAARSLAVILLHAIEGLRR
jgi:undecaprenyl-diphosphatase